MKVSSQLKAASRLKAARQLNLASVASYLLSTAKVNPKIATVMSNLISHYPRGTVKDCIIHTAIHRNMT